MNEEIKYTISCEQNYFGVPNWWQCQFSGWILLLIIFILTIILILIIILCCCCFCLYKKKQSEVVSYFSQDALNFGAYKSERNPIWEIWNQNITALAGNGYEGSLGSSVPPLQNRTTNSHKNSQNKQTPIATFKDEMILSRVSQESEFIWDFEKMKKQQSQKSQISEIFRKPENHGTEGDVHISKNDGKHPRDYFKEKYSGSSSLTKKERRSTNLTDMEFDAAFNYQLSLLSAEVGDQRPYGSFESSSQAPQKIQENSKEDSIDNILNLLTNRNRSQSDFFLDEELQIIGDGNSLDSRRSELSDGQTMPFIPEEKERLEIFDFTSGKNKNSPRRNIPSSDCHVNDRNFNLDESGDVNFPPPRPSSVFIEYLRGSNSNNNSNSEYLRGSGSYPDL